MLFERGELGQIPPHLAVEHMVYLPWNQEPKLGDLLNPPFPISQFDNLQKSSSNFPKPP
jgi:hypothetical protein